MLLPNVPGATSIPKSRVSKVFECLHMDKIIDRNGHSSSHLLHHLVVLAKTLKISKISKQSF